MNHTKYLQFNFKWVFNRQCLRTFLKHIVYLMNHGKAIGKMTYSYRSIMISLRKLQFILTLICHNFINEQLINWHIVDIKMSICTKIGILIVFPIQEKYDICKNDLNASYNYVFLLSFYESIESSRFKSEG